MTLLLSVTSWALPPARLSLERCHLPVSLTVVCNQLGFATGKAVIREEYDSTRDSWSGGGVWGGGGGEVGERTGGACMCVLYLCTLYMLYFHLPVSTAFVSLFFFEENFPFFFFLA